MTKNYAIITLKFCILYFSLDENFRSTEKWNAGLDKLRAPWRRRTYRARKEVFVCTKLCACKSLKTHLSNTTMLFKCYLLYKNIVLQKSSPWCVINDFFYLKKKSFALKRSRSLCFCEIRFKIWDVIIGTGA